uniref:Uncharacterized protein n=1 Tax=Rhizophora mucronata TaxID=61149 RepID=A0A2P2MYL9_RHIMU
MHRLKTRNKAMNLFCHMHEEMPDHSVSVATFN